MLALRYELRKRGLRVGQIGTEHHSGCFGFDYTFPNGYGAQYSLKIPMDYHIPLLRRVISEMDKGQYDVIIVGAQSGLLSPDYYYYDCLYSELVLSACMPDYTLLVANEFDDAEFVKRIENLVKVKTSQEVSLRISNEELKVSVRRIINEFLDKEMKL